MALKILLAMLLAAPAYASIKVRPADALEKKTARVVYRYKPELICARWEADRCVARRLQMQWRAE